MTISTDRMTKRCSLRGTRAPEVPEMGVVFWTQALRDLCPPAVRTGRVSESPKRVVSEWVLSWDPSFALHIKTHI